MTLESKRVIRCAIYTRKSSEEGLEQSFNSLDAQREACEAFVTSQRQEGWRALPGHYDDGGYSGGTLERPALQRLLKDVEERKVDTIVVYKVDRLTRSLADFAKIVEALDARGVSFRICHSAVQHHNFYGAADPECAALLRPVRKGSDRRENTGQDRSLQTQRDVDGWQSASRI